MSDDTRETIPITSPLAVLATRTTQEHIMTTHSTTDLKPGDIVQHPEKGRGYILRHGEGGSVRVIYAGQARTLGFDLDLDTDGWERVETCTAGERRILDDFREVASGEAQEAVYPEAGVVIAPHDAFKQRPELVRPGHVQVRVDDLDLRSWAVLGEDHYSSAAFRAGVRVAKAVTAQRAESAPPAEEQERDEKPTSATVTLYCPDCGEPITNTAMVEVNREGERYLDFCNVNVHTCPPAQPDEPTEPGIHVAVCDMRLVSLVQNSDGKRFFADVKSGRVYFWDDLTERGTVTIGWDE